MSNSAAKPPFPHQAMAAYEAGRREEAERICRNAVQREPRNVEALHMLGGLKFERGDWDGALTCFKRAAALNPAHPHVLNNLGLALNAAGRPREAAERFQQAIAAHPAFAEAYCNLGTALLAIGADNDALVSFDRAIALAPALARAHCNRGCLLHKLRRLQEALDSQERVLAIQPDYAEAQAWRAVLLVELGRPGEALASLDQVLQGQPNNWMAYMGRATVLQTFSRFEDALGDCERAVAIAPHSALTHNARAAALTHLARHAEALDAYQRSMMLDPHNVLSGYNAAMCLLRLGRFTEGWALHEWRKRSPRSMASRPQAGREWIGGEPLAGRTLLVAAEQGLGDTLQFCRFATLAARAGARVVLEVPASLRTLLSSLEGVAAVVGAEDPLPQVDFSSLLMSLPLAFGTTLDTIPAQVPYLRCDAGRLQAWRERLGPKKKLRVGLAWSGGLRPDEPEFAATNQRRNLPLALLAPLAHPDIEFFSLQKGEVAEAELARLAASGWNGPQISDFSALLNDFADTAALLEQLDLIISVDTSTAHLAGALGKPVWILNRFDNCWRWLTDRSDSPWYPTARLYRQQRPGDWPGVIGAVRADLAALITEARPSCGKADFPA